MLTSIQGLNGEASPEIMYLPAGIAKVYASVGGKPQTLEVQVGALTARLLQSDLEELLGSSVKPFIDFDYAGQAAAADPKRFVWKPGQGLFLGLTWTRSGRAAVEGKDYRYFCPALRLNTQGEIEGLPSNGAIGALLNKPIPSSGSARAAVASALEASQVRSLDNPFAKMLATRKVISTYRRAHPGMSTDEVFRCLKQQDPQLWKD